MTGEFVGHCCECGCELNGVHKSRFIRNKYRRCAKCYRANIKGWHYNDGYVRVAFRPGRRGKKEYLHRIVASQMLGRELMPSEVVHHINGIKDDNRPENLAVYDDPGTHVLKAGHVSKGKHGKFIKGSDNK